MAIINDLLRNRKLRYGIPLCVHLNDHNDDFHHHSSLRRIRRVSCRGMFLLLF